MVSETAVRVPLLAYQAFMATALPSYNWKKEMDKNFKI